MISYKGNPVEWALLMGELEDAHEHLGELISKMVKEEKIEIEEYTVHIAHIYAHLNRAWNTRDIEDDVSEAQWEAVSAFPTDIEPIG
ncbi:hypothetical protein [Thaumasiovibrio subtropicus]|uniref:hypothetical protein n=1 Tax=Thaumasiovibrio subtropicus TaxID=1891207 RepID=UPI000B350768|nr:hypothetical protein [Thaumasiovibrio subtropicus]